VGQVATTGARDGLKARREELCLSVEQVARAVGVDRKTVWRWETGESTPYLRQRPALAEVLELSLDEIEQLLAGQSVEPAKPPHLGKVLHDVADEVAGFTRRAETTAVGRATLEHLERVVADVSAAYSRGAPAEVFTVAHTHRRQVDELLQGPHTLAEGRELYVQAAWLSEILAWVTHDLGSTTAADAYCVDAFEHAHQAGHAELCGWAMDARASIALYDDRPADALRSALRGADAAPAAHPLVVRLHAQAARALAVLGRRDDAVAELGRAADAFERLPTRPPTRFGKDTTKLARYAITAYSATAYLSLGMFDRARGYANEALAEHRSAPERDRSPSREAIARLDLATALAGLGEPEEAARLGHAALASPRVVDSVLVRATGLGAALTGHHPDLTETRDYRDALALTTGGRPALPS
jgi:transcriptional regulator with XRE-family HTH domain